MRQNDIDVCPGMTPRGKVSSVTKPGAAMMRVHSHASAIAIRCASGVIVFLVKIKGVTPTSVVKERGLAVRFIVVLPFANVEAWPPADGRRLSTIFIAIFRLRGVLTGDITRREGSEERGEEGVDVVIHFEIGRSVWS